MTVFDQQVPARRPRPNVLTGSSIRFAGTLLLALVATKPAFEAAVTEGESLPTALVRFLTAFGVLWVLGGIASALLRREPVGEAAPDATRMSQLAVSELAVSETVPGAAGSDR